MQLTKNSVVLVTGAQGALGREVGRVLEAKGMKVMGVDRTDCNLGIPGELKKWVASQEIAGVVHCAGGFRWQTTESWSASDLEFLIQANFISTWNVFETFAQKFKSKKSGRIVVIGAHGALTPISGMGPYAASKAATHALVQSVADELKTSGVQVNAMLPTVIDTPANRKDMPQVDPSQWVSMTQIAEMAYYLLAEAPDSLTGALISLKGGV